MCYVLRLVGADEPNRKIYTTIEDAYNKKQESLDFDGDQLEIMELVELGNYRLINSSDYPDGMRVRTTSGERFWNISQNSLLNVTGYKKWINKAWYGEFTDDLGNICYLPM